MDASPLVTVFNYRRFDHGSDAPLIEPYKATREAIAGELHSELLEGTGEQVPSTELDSHGRYRRLATGWGDLDSILPAD